MAFEYTVDQGAGLLTVTGELDFALAGHLRTLGASAVNEPSTTALHIDLAGVTFIDSSGIGALVDIRNQADARAVNIIIIRPSPSVRRVLEVTGLTQVFLVE